MWRNFVDQNQLGGLDLHTPTLESYVHMHVNACRFPYPTILRGSREHVRKHGQTNNTNAVPNSTMVEDESFADRNEKPHTQTFPKQISRLGMLTSRSPKATVVRTVSLTTLYTNQTSGAQPHARYKDLDMQSTLTNMLHNPCDHKRTLIWSQRRKKFQSNEPRPIRLVWHAISRRERKEEH